MKSSSLPYVIYFAHFTPLYFDPLTILLKKKDCVAADVYWTVHHCDN